MLSPAASKKPKTFKLRALGLCGADDSVNPNLLAMISHSYPFVEFGVLFRPDKVLYIYCIYSTGLHCNSQRSSFLLLYYL
jgi:hypothetical protein